MTLEARPSEHGSTPPGVNQSSLAAPGSLGADGRSPGPAGRQAFATAVSAKPARHFRSHLPAVDGVRGVAILLVMLTHTWQMPKVSWPDRFGSFLVSIGWSGVELFFVLSGFLITGILLDSKGGRHYFRNFYLRR